MDQVDDRIQWLKSHRKFNHVEETLKNTTSRKELTRLQNNFVITPIDKAGNNIAFICQRYYARVLIRELGLNEPSENPTYQENADLKTEDVM